jgi:hypothetical protein
VRNLTSLSSERDRQSYNRLTRLGCRVHSNSNNRGKRDHHCRRFCRSPYGLKTLRAGRRQHGRWRWRKQCEKHRRGHTFQLVHNSNLNLFRTRHSPCQSFPVVHPCPRLCRLLCHCLWTQRSTRHLSETRAMEDSGEVYGLCGDHYEHLVSRRNTPCVSLLVSSLHTSIHHSAPHSAKIRGLTNDQQNLAEANFKELGPIPRICINFVRDYGKCYQHVIARISYQTLRRLSSMPETLTWMRHRMGFLSSDTTT